MLPRRGSRGDADSAVGVWSDLAVVAVLAVAAAPVLLSAASPRPLRWGLGIPFLLLWPGYAVVSALYPEQPKGRSTAVSRKYPGVVSRAEAIASPGWAARAALSLGVSGTVVALVVIASNQVAAVRTGPVVAGILLVTLAGTGIAVGRRLLLTPEDRAAPVAVLAGRAANGSGVDDGPGGSPSGRATGGETSSTRRQTVALVVATALLVVTVAVAGAVPMESERFTESSLLVENDTGDLVATDYPTAFVAGEGHPLTIALENNEHRPVTYQVIVLAQDVDANGSVTAQRRVDEFEVDTIHGEVTLVERQITPTTTGEGVRLRFLIYDDGAAGVDGEGGSADGDGDLGEPDQVLQLWIDVVERGE